jgi:hypothetical protein
VHISQEAYGPTSAVTYITSTALHWCNRPHRTNGLTKSYGNREVPKKDYDERNEENGKKPQKRKRATKGR